MYSTDRSDALAYTLSCLEDMPLYDQCQKTLIVDGKIDVVPKDWQAVQVPRIDGRFCWGRMWDAGVFSARFDKIIYLDSDRLLPKSFIELVNDKVEPDLFLYTSRHFMMVSDVELEVCKRLLEEDSMETLLMSTDFLGKFRYECRFGKICHGPSKNVMSGSTAFTKSTYMRLGGVDKWYCGHGAFADSDFHMQAAKEGCRFLDLELTELHYHHDKKDQGSKLSNEELYKLGLDNFIYYCHKWGLPMAFAESLAVRCGVSKPSVYVGKKVKLIKANAKQF